jgi:putative tricarboxylic transport membrane protein
MTMRRVHQVASLAILALGAFLLQGALGLHYFTSIGPGPGFFPVWLSIILCALACLMFLTATFGATTPAPADLIPDAGGVLRIGAVVVALAGTALLLTRIGFAPTMLLMNLFVLVALGRHRPLTVLAIAVAGSFGIGWVFDALLGVPLPATDLGALCPSMICGE